VPQKDAYSSLNAGGKPTQIGFGVKKGKESERSQEPSLHPEKVIEKKGVTIANAKQKLALRWKRGTVCKTAVEPVQKRWTRHKSPPQGGKNPRGSGKEKVVALCRTDPLREGHRIAKGPDHLRQKGESLLSTSLVSA